MIFFDVPCDISGDRPNCDCELDCYAQERGAGIPFSTDDYHSCLSACATDREPCDSGISGLQSRQSSCFISCASLTTDAARNACLSDCRVAYEVGYARAHQEDTECVASNCSGSPNAYSKRSVQCYLTADQCTAGYRIAREHCAAAAFAAISATPSTEEYTVYLQSVDACNHISRISSVPCNAELNQCLTHALDYDFRDPERDMRNRARLGTQHAYCWAKKCEPAFLLAMQQARDSKTSCDAGCLALSADDIGDEQFVCLFKCSTSGVASTASARIAFARCGFTSCCERGSDPFASCRLDAWETWMRCDTAAFINDPPNPTDPKEDIASADRRDIAQAKCQRERDRSEDICVTSFGKQRTCGKCDEEAIAAPFINLSAPASILDPAPLIFPEPPRYRDFY